MTNSNQYPRLAWVVELDATSKPAYVARPHGPDAGWARVYLQRRNLDGYWWSWTVHWRDRFSHGGMLNSKQDAADRATIAYWDAMEATEGWLPAPLPPPPPAPPLPAMMIIRNMRRWLATARQQDAKARLRQYMMAAIHGPTSSGDRDIDRWIWTTLGDTWPRLPE